MLLEASNATIEMHPIFPVSLSKQQVVTGQPVYISSTKHTHTMFTNTYEQLIRRVTPYFSPSCKTLRLLSAFKLLFPGAISQCSTSCAHTAAYQWDAIMLATAILTPATTAGQGERAADSTSKNLPAISPYYTFVTSVCPSSVQYKQLTPFK